MVGEDLNRFLDSKKMFENWFELLKGKKVTIKPKKTRGRLLWDSSANGTYVKSKHGELK